MNDRRDTIVKYAWVAAVVAFVVVFGYVLVASSPREYQPTAEPPATLDREPIYSARIPAAPPMEPAPVMGYAPSEPQVRVTPTAPLVMPAAPAGVKGQRVVKVAPKPPKITPRDMFPVGDIYRSVPTVSHPYRQIAELYPSFAYLGKLWFSTGRFVHSGEADLVATGKHLATGQNLFELPNHAQDGVLFVQSELDPAKFAVYRAT